MQKITQKEFENAITNFKKVELSLDKKDEMKSKIIASGAVQKSPYFSAFHFSYQKMFVTAFALVLFISISTAEASKYSLPGDLLYPIKTNIREPLIKFTKITQKEKADFDLVLADTRIQELEELIVKNKTTEKNIGENSVLFEKHIEDSKKDRRKEEKGKTEIKPETEIETETEANLSVKIKSEETKSKTKDEDKNEAEIDLEIETELEEIEEDFELNSRVEKYNDLMISIYDTNIR